MATGKDLRRMALALEGTTEAPHFDRAAFKVARIYATLAADGRTANFKFTPDEQEFKCMMAPEAFAPVPNAWGKQGWTTATLSKLSAAELKAAHSQRHGRMPYPRRRGGDKLRSSSRAGAALPALCRRHGTQAQVRVRSLSGFGATGPRASREFSPLA